MIAYAYIIPIINTDYIRIHYDITMHFLDVSELTSEAREVKLNYVSHQWTLGEILKSTRFSHLVRQVVVLVGTIAW